MPPFGPHTCPRMGLGRGPHLGWPWSAACHPALLACAYIVGAGPGPPALPATARGKWLVCPSKVCLNPLLKTSRVGPSFSLAHGEGSGIRVHQPPTPSTESDGFDPQAHFTDEDTDGPGGPQSPAETAQLGESRAGFQPSYKVLENNALTGSVAPLRSSWGQGPRRDQRLFP